MKLKKEIKRISPVVKRIIKDKAINVITQLFSDDSIMPNCFHSDYDKKVLLSYIKEPFKNPDEISKRHTNLTECYTIAKIFDKLGFRIDCIESTSSLKVNFENYDVFLGIGTNIFPSSFFCLKNIIRIYYSPGAHPMYASIGSSMRIREVYNNTKKWMISSYLYGGPKNWCYSVLLTDHVIVVGNDFVKENYTKWDKQYTRYSNLNLFYFNCFLPDLNNKVFFKSQKNFLWFGSRGLIHKGLDICMDIFLKRDDITLHICGAPHKETEFWSYYAPLIKNCRNIIDHGFVDIESGEFAEILSQCAFVVNPSVSEGGAGALLNVIANGGLFPIYSKATGVDFDNNGIEVDEISIDSFERAIDSALNITIEDLKQKSITLNKYVRELYTLENYEINMERIIKKILSDKGLNLKL